MQRKFKRSRIDTTSGKSGGNGAIRNAAGPMQNRREKRAQAAYDQEIQRQLEDYYKGKR